MTTQHNDDNIKEIEIPPARNDNTIFLRAKFTNQKQFLGQYVELCNDVSEEDCSVDHIYVYVLPNGELDTVRIHTFNKMGE